VISLGVLSGCASAPGGPVGDPYESLNRKVFAFNEGADRAILSPLARGYKRATPQTVRHGISNFFANLGDLGGTVNAALQGRGRRALYNGSRFLINSTVGLFGLLDVASPLGIQRYQTDFGETLATWGVGSGPYLVVPLLGPRTARSGVGSGVDLVLQQAWRGGGALLPAVEAVDGRAGFLEAELLITGDRYVFIREAYLQQRAAKLGLEIPGADFAASDEAYDWGD
jgi:phospholipid-binding lipoprotein MlaA